jgi:starch phosphorylase
MWGDYKNICEIKSITNAQNKTYWSDAVLDKALAKGDGKLISARKKDWKFKLFRIVANQTGKLFDPNVLTIVWARRFAAYKRADLLLSDYKRFLKIAQNKKLPIQIIWAGKPYPEDYSAINIFNEIYWKTKDLPNCTVLTGYEIWLSGHLKKGSDVWLNNPRILHEASGTSGMTAAMNGSINLSIPDGWVPEFAKHGKNCFIIQPSTEPATQEARDKVDAQTLLDLLEHEVIPMYYTNPSKWLKIMKSSMEDVLPDFDSGRMAKQYYQELYLK